ncbi:MAG TPA: hypothetical protein VKN74_08205 [Candidatus Mcinerneyibacterium sp.]|nr:hypothetical protein [Candidatus Mcinerneyibacterium sp.]
MKDYEKILVLENVIEAGRLESLLKEEEIPFHIESYHDYAYDGIFQLQKGWGHVEAPIEYKDKIIKIYKQMKENK